MTRRNLIFGLLAGVSVGATQNTYSDVPRVWNEFAGEANVWAKMRLETPEGTYNWPALKQWKDKVKPAFHAVDVAVKNE